MLRRLKRVKGWQKSVSTFARRCLIQIERYITDANLDISLLLLALTVGIAFVWFRYFPTQLADYRTEFVGLIFDVVFILVFLSLFEHRRRKTQDRKRQQEIIEDYKRWDSEEARIRLAGAVRRLNKLDVTAINFTGARLSDFSFATQGIPDLSGSTFYDGTWGEPLRPSDVRLSRVDFSWVRCSRVKFSPLDPLGGLLQRPSDFAEFIDCTFYETDLSRALFNGSHLHWSEPPPVSLYDEDQAEDGSPISVQVRYGHFEKANLEGASFRNVFFDNADFRGAENIASANFEGSKGLETCVFDRNALQNEHLRKANVRTG